MLTVTETAKEKLKEALQQRVRQSEATFRLIVSSSGTRCFQLGLGEEREGDQVVESVEGTRLLLIGPILAAELEGLVFDYEETDKGFTISMPSPGT
ncbi:MAG: hypothetical protein ACE5MK_02515 [Acidobacteriota bacterium]